MCRCLETQLSCSTHLCSNRKFFEVQNCSVKIRMPHSLYFQIRKSRRSCLFCVLRTLCSKFWEEKAPLRFRVNAFSRYGTMKTKFLALDIKYRSKNGLLESLLYNRGKQYPPKSTAFLYCLNVCFIIIVCSTESLFTLNFSCSSLNSMNWKSELILRI